MRLDEMFDFLPKSIRSASYGQLTGLYPFYTSSNVVDKFIDDYDYEGEFLIVGDGGTGNCKYVNGRFSVSDHNFIMKPLNNTNIKCVKYFLMKDNYKILNAGFKGVGIKNVSKSYIKKIVYKYNQSFTEDFIVLTLSNIEQLIEEQNNALIKLDEIIKSRFIDQEGISYVI